MATPRESSILIVFVGFTAGMVWTVCATLWGVDRDLAALNTVDGVVERAVVWPASVVWGFAALFVHWGISPPHPWVLMGLVGAALGGLISLIALYWVGRGA